MPWLMFSPAVFRSQSHSHDWLCLTIVKALSLCTPILLLADSYARAHMSPVASAGGMVSMALTLTFGIQ
jgi:hypothetical protein